MKYSSKLDKNLLINHHEISSFCAKLFALSPKLDSMDPKTSSSLDPKLKEVYDRVMGAPTNQATPQQQPIAVATPPSPASATPTPPPATKWVPPSPLPPPPPPVASALGQPAQTVQPLTNNQPPANLAPTPAPDGTLSPLNPPLSQTPTGNDPSASGTTNSANKTAIDYAALAAKYATPVPTIGTETTSPRPAVVTPSTTMYGVVNDGNTKKAASDKPEKTDKKRSGGMKKLLLFLGIPILLIAYTVIWVVVFGVDLTQLLPQ